jgi:hypothetical protein
VIERVSRSFVPVALNLYKIRKAKGNAGDFFRKVQKQRPAQYQGIYIVSPAGKVLANQANQPGKGKSWTQDLIDTIDLGIKAHGTVEPRTVKAVDPLPHRGVGAGDGGQVTLALYTRYLLLGLDRRGFGTVAIDSVVLSGEDWKTLAPPSGESKEWTVPPRVARQLHRVLSPTSDQNSMARADEVSTVRLTGKVRSVEDGIAYLDYQGEIAGEHVYAFDPHKGKKIRARMTLTGVGTYDVKAKRLRSLTLVGEGTFRMFAPYDTEQKYGAVVEWRDKR